jgi:hypothetical protein
MVYVSRVELVDPIDDLITVNVSVRAMDETLQGEFTATGERVGEFHRQLVDFLNTRRPVSVDFLIRRAETLGLHLKAQVYPVIPQ